MYYAKGTADYVGIWDFDEFFQPRGQNKNLLDVIESAEPAKDSIPFAHEPNKTSMDVYLEGWKPARGMADKDGHPFCYLVLDSEVTLVPKRIEPDTEPVRALPLHPYTPLTRFMRISPSPSAPFPYFLSLHSFFSVDSPKATLDGSDIRTRP